MSKTGTLSCGVEKIFYCVKEARHISDYTIWIKFSDGTEGEINLKDELKGPIFEPLKDLEMFRSFRVDPELHTLVWQNGADFAPEFLYEQIRVRA
ncbi:MAG: DUF2442 domain-containing protein [Acidobacteriota bacterium]